MKAFEISEVQSLTKNGVEVNGRALTKLKQGDEIYFSLDKKNRAQLLKIIFWGDEIDEIEAPHNCTLVLNTGEFISESKYLYK